jgi:alpha-methylacyl-CoA racemase
MGPLHGVRVIEIAALGPAPFAAMMLADMGADVIRVDRVSDVARPSGSPDLLARGRRSIALDLKTSEGVDALLRLVERADVLLEGFRPGVLERLGVGPEVCLARNPRVVIGRMTGWGQEGPRAHTAGHDINYIALAGALAHIGRAGEAPTPPINLVGDFGGGGMLLAFGVVCGLLDAARTGAGQVVDAAMVDGTALLMTMIWSMQRAGMWSDVRGTNVLDSGAPQYDVYATADDKYIAVGALEPQFYAALLGGLGIDPALFPDPLDPSCWPEMRKQFRTAFSQRTQAEWDATFAGIDACVTPVLTMRDAANDPHLVARRTLIESFGVRQPAPAPRFSRHAGNEPRRPARVGEHTEAVLRDAGYTTDEIDALLAQGVAAQQTIVQ